MAELVSRHLVRRTARAKARRLDKRDPTHNHMVERFYGRLYRWQVVRVAR
jgi:hypothetical protein